MRRPPSEAIWDTRTAPMPGNLGSRPRIDAMKAASLSQKAYALLMFVAVSVLAGLLLAGLAVPFTALAGTTTKTVADGLQYLPDELETPPQAERSRILMADGSVLATFFDENRIYVPLDKIAPIMQDAQVAIEDHRFFEHGAIDVQGLARALMKTAMGDTQGASTLTQQYVKMVQVEAAIARGDEEAAREAVAVNVERKIREMRYAMAVEERLSKNEILERYLNIAYYGSGAYGVEAAAHRYWGTTAAELTLDQAAMLAGLVQNPVQTDPIRHPERAIKRRNVVLNRMAELGMITQADADAAKEVPFDPAGVKTVPNGCVASEFPFLCDYVFRTLKSDKMASLGENPEQRENLLRRGGLTIQTLINPEAQRAAEAAIANQIAPTDPVLSTMVNIQPSTGLIVAMAQSRPKMGDNPGEIWWNINVSRSMGGAEGYQAGSTFKTFTMAAALAAGYTPSKQYDATSSIDLRGRTYKSCSGPFVFRDKTTVSNYDRGYGRIDMIKGAENSVNTYFMQLIQDVGICKTIEMAKAAGVKMANGKDLTTQDRYPSFTLGTVEATPLSMAEAYATFANRGVHCDPIILQSATTKDGKDLAVPGANCEQVIDPGVADGVSYILQKVMSNGTGRPARMSDGRPQAGKTGTINDNQAVWFAGYTPDMVGVAMIAIDKTNPWYDSHPRTLKNVKLPSGTFLKGSGGGDAGLIWKAAMASALQGVDPTPFTAPPTQILEGVKVPLPSVKGMSYDQAKQTLEDMGFTTVKWEVHSERPAGSFLGISPSKEAVQFSTISLKVSIGPAPVEPPPTTTEGGQAPADNAGPNGIPNMPNIPIPTPTRPGRNG